MKGNIKNKDTEDFEDIVETEGVENIEDTISIISETGRSDYTDISDNSSDGESVPDEEVHIRETIIKYIEVDNIIREMTAEHKESIKGLKTDKKAAEKDIIKFMEDKGRSQINIGNNGKLILNKSDRRGKPNADNFKTSIMRKLEDIKKGKTKKLEEKEFCESVMKYLDETIPVKTYTNLKRTFTRSKKS